MICHKCDRCGTQYDNNSRLHMDDGPIMYNFKYDFIDPMDQYKNGTRSLDLCPKCSFEFKQFLQYID
jgi:protein-arginine kinase activator protein McsA